MPLAVVDPVTLGANLYLIIGGVVLAIFLLIGIVVLWTGINAGIWRARQARDERAARNRKFRADGTPLPPAHRGLCDRCQKPYERVYYLPDGERYCPKCYEAVVKET